jgi:hypothetical protein
MTESVTDLLGEQDLRGLSVYSFRRIQAMSLVNSSVNPRLIWSTQTNILESSSYTCNPHFFVTGPLGADKTAKVTLSNKIKQHA